MSKTLVFLRTENSQVFDGSVKGSAVKLGGDARPAKVENAFNLSKGFIEIGNTPDFEKASSFTFEATVTAAAIGPGRQNIMESQTPPAAFFINPQGFIVGSVNTPAGWQGIQSTEALQKGKSSHVRFSRNDNGQLDLEINGKNVGSKTISGALVPVGKLPLKVGSGVDGKAFQFQGEIGNIQVRDTAFSTNGWNTRIANAKALEISIKNKIGLNVPVLVNPSLDESHVRLQPIKDIMNAAGVERLSDLTTLRITTKTNMTRGKVLIASSKNDISTIDWSVVADSFAKLDKTKKKEHLAKFLPNRNSNATIKSAVADSGQPRQIKTKEVSAKNPNFLLFKPQVNLASFINVRDAGLKVINKDVMMKNLQDKSPAQWPMLTQNAKPLSLKTIPIGTAVIIAGTLDLTDTQLVIEPDVEKLYIIAERVICGPNALITWRKPGGSTPPRASNPDLNGRGWSGIQTKPNSRDGLDGEDGRSGESGIAGASGRNAPQLEMWVKEMTNIPNVDLNGEDGIIGGIGQRGGKGGNGAAAAGGERIWFFGWHCTSDPGDGGHGGNGGNGGRGGTGGRGGNGAALTIGVLDGTLAATVTNNSFKLKTQGGNQGRGANGGSGGTGGFGGRSGNGETCTSADNGRNGAQGQPGAQGPDGASKGVDGLAKFFQFTEEAWEEMLTRPFITEISPTEAFPGNTVIIRGSRFTSTDRLIIDAAALVPVINADESITVTLPTNTSGGTKSIFLRRSDGTESNRISLRIKPQLDAITSGLAPNATIPLSGKAFITGASVLINGNAIPATVTSATQLTFVMPGTGGSGSTGGSVNIEVRNPDGLTSNTRTAVRPNILEIPFTYGVHNLPFNNFTDGLPTMGTFEDTFGTAEVWHELLDPVFGHPILTGAFYVFYEHFLKGTANGGLATGFCTSLASLVADKLWKGENDAISQTEAAWKPWLTGVHGKLLSRESLLHFHDQGLQGTARVEATYREIERTFLTGCDRNVAPLLFFIPSGEVWDSGYFDKLSDSHCIMPYRFIYPSGRTPQLSANGSTTTTDLDGVELFCWDCNNPTNPNCRVRFRRVGGEIRFDFLDGGSTVKFRSEDGITLGMMTNGDYLLSDHDLPFSGPFGLTSFIVDFLLSPADLQITDESGLRIGKFGNQIFSEVPDSHPCYLIKGAYLMPENRSYTKRIVGSGVGTYTYNSIMPNGTTIKIENVNTQVGHNDTLMINSDASQVRFAPHAEKSFTVTFSKLIGNQVRSLAIGGAGGGPSTEVDITVSPDLSIFRLGNRSTAKNVEVKAFTTQRAPGAVVVNRRVNLSLPTNHDLIVTVPNWTTVNLAAEAIAF